MTRFQHQARWWFSRGAGLGVAVTLLCGCGKPADPQVVSCKVPNGSHAMCMEYVRPRSDLLRSSILAECRDGGGLIVDACPVEGLVGTCERATDPSKPTSLSERVRMKTYFQNGGVNPPDVARLKEHCLKGAGEWTQPGN